MEPREKAKTILAAIIQAAGGSFNGKTRLNKAFYVAHLIHFRDNKGVLSDYPIVRLPKGPAIDASDLLLSELRDAGVVEISHRPVGPTYREDVFIIRKPIGGLNAEELESVRRAVEWIDDKTGSQVSDWTHEFSNTWDETPNGQEMNIYADLLSEQEYAEMKRRHQSAKEMVDAVFAQ